MVIKPQDTYYSIWGMVINPQETYYSTWGMVINPQDTYYFTSLTLRTLITPSEGW